MPAHYRATFTLAKPDAPPSQTLADAWQCAQDWASDEYGTPADTRFTRSSASGDMTLCALTHQYADAASRAWRLSVRLAADANAVAADIDLRAADAPDADPAPDPAAPPPSLVRALLERFDCRAGADPLSVNATRINAHDADSFVKNELLSENRLLPLLAVTDPRDGISVIDADKMQQELAGLARVFAYSHSAAWNVARDLPQSLWCYDGAVRLFAPGCSEDDLAQQHPFWLPRHLEGVMRDNRLWQMLRDECLLRISHQRQANLISRVENAITAEETKTLQDRMAILEQTNPTAKAFLDFLDLLDDSDIGGDQVRIGLYRAAIGYGRILNNKANRLALENDQLRAENSQLRAKSSAVAGEPSPLGNGDTPTEQRFSSIHACAKHAAQNLPYLRFLPNALETARSRYTREYDEYANRIYKAFEVLNECGRQRTQPGGLGKNVELWLKENRVEYSDESDPTKREYRNERIFPDPDKGEDIFMPHHIKLIGNKLRIHLIWDGDENKWLIGYIGRHLRTAQSPN